MSVIRLITFDVTGTLLAFRKPVMQQYAEEAIQYGINADPENLLPQFKATWKDLSKSHPNFGFNGLGWTEWWRRIVVGTFCNELKTERSKEQVNLLASHLISYFTTVRAWKAVDGCDEVLRSLKKQGFELGVVSNFDPRLHEILYNMELSQYFSFVLTSYEAGFEKPDARIFQKALSKINIAPSEAIHIGNDEINDLNGAQSAGIRPILVTKDKKKIPSVVCNLRDVIKCVKILNKPSND